MKLAVKIAVGLVACLALGLCLLKFNYGGGERYQDLSTDPAIAESGLEKLVALDFPPGNVAVSADNRIFFAYHPFAKAERFSDATLFELVNGKDPHDMFQPRKHTVIVQPGSSATFDLTADEPGDWAFHCHLLYHMHAGMMQVVTVRPFPEKA